MVESFTSNQFVQYLYHETDAADTFAIAQAIREDFFAREEFRELFGAYRQLPKVQFSPSPASIQHILRYSERSALTEHA